MSTRNIMTFGVVLHWVKSFLNSPFWSRPTMLWLAHATPVIWLVSAVVGPTLSHFPRSLLLVALVLWLAIGVGMVISIFVELTHEPTMCRRCAANMPLNHTRAARLVRSALWLHHHKLIPLGTMCAASVGSLVDAFPDSWDTARSVLVCLMFAALAQAFLLHRAHRIWCPWCNGWGDDPDAPQEPTLDPTQPGKTVTR